MKLQHIALMGLISLSTVPFALPAQACTPAPDNPNGCDGLNGNPRINPRIIQLQRRPKFPIGPVCLSCPPLKVKGQDQILQTQPVLQKEQILPNQGHWQQGFEQPQSFGR